MASYFIPPRRKLGVAILFIALSAWALSFLALEYLCVVIGGRLHLIVPIRGTVYWSARDQPHIKELFFRLSIPQLAVDRTGYDVGAMHAIAMTKLSPYEGQNAKLWVFSYWWILTPWILLAVYLLISKPWPPRPPTRVLRPSSETGF